MLDGVKIDSVGKRWKRGYNQRRWLAIVLYKERICRQIYKVYKKKERERERVRESTAKEKKME
jgi:hypothetical protein